MSEVVELTPLWKQGGGPDMKSADMMDDRVQELVEAMQSGPVKLYYKAAQTKRSSRSPDGYLLIIPQGKKGKR